MTQFPKTLGDLKKSPFGVPAKALRSVKDEMRQNLLSRLCVDGPLFPGVIGYEESVMPQIANAILSRHNFILLGLRGQAKSRILRSLLTLLDDAFERQLLNYLRATDLEVGLLLNFGPRPGFRRLVYANQRKHRQYPRSSAQICGEHRRE
jgi:hypothetical protein